MVSLKDCNVEVDTDLNLGGRVGYFLFFLFRGGGKGGGVRGGGWGARFNRK